MIGVAQAAGLGRNLADYDADFGSVSLLLHHFGTNGSTTFTDLSSKARTVTANGNAQISTTAPKFTMGGSALLDGTGDYLTCAASADLGFDATTSGCIEMWVNAAWNGAADNVLVDTTQAGGAPNTRALFYVDKTTKRLAYFDGAVSGNLGTALANSTWYFVKFAITSSTIFAYLDGTQQWSIARQAFAASSPMTIGADSAGTQAVNGKFGPIRVTKGASRVVEPTPYWLFPTY